MTKDKVNEGPNEGDSTGSGNRSKSNDKSQRKLSIAKHLPQDKASKERAAKELTMYVHGGCNEGRCASKDTDRKRY